MTLALALLLPLAVAEAQAPVVIDGIAAVVNKSVVLRSEVETVLDQMMQSEPVPQGGDVDKARAARRSEILETLIAEKLLEEEVRKLRIDVTDAEVDRVVKGTMQEHGLDDAKLQMALQRQGLSLDEYQDGLKKQLTKMKIIQLKVKSRVQVNDQDVKSSYAQRKALDAGEFRVRARHILFLVPPGESGRPQEQRAKEALARLQGGADFAALAKELSEDPGSKERGGDLGEFGRGEMVPEFERAAYTAEVARVVGPVRSPFGWHLIRVDEHVALKAKPEEQALEDIRKRLYEDEMETQFRQYLEELKRAAYIERR
ncbi:MAG: hypothetical protein A2138_11415 [Deltaproteobacteria bacterium RBG_16_71_12]|nr:MAG: hypothetical protein A2138_11415 [Deltaproteobacteria bacterium RBG_16_71_12]